MNADEQSRKRQEIRDSLPARYGAVRRLTERVADLEEQVAELKAAVEEKP